MQPLPGTQRPTPPLQAAPQTASASPAAPVLPNPTATPTPTAVLRVQGLTKHYGATPVFSQIHLTVLPGEFVAIVGESGVGKSTLLNCLAGLDSWDSGTVVLGGIDVGKLSDTARALLRRRTTGFVFQAFHVLPHLSVAQNVSLPLLLLGQGKDPALALRVEAALESVGLEGLSARLPHQLSGGQLQRVAIARALIHRPPVLLADEPTGNVDASTAAKVLDNLIVQTRAHSASLILATHSEAVAARADRVLILRPDGLYPTPRLPLRERATEPPKVDSPMAQSPMAPVNRASQNESAAQANALTKLRRGRAGAAPSNKAAIAPAVAPPATPKGSATSAPIPPMLKRRP